MLPSPRAVTFKAREPSPEGPPRLEKGRKASEAARGISPEPKKLPDEVLIRDRVPHKTLSAGNFPKLGGLPPDSDLDDEEFERRSYPASVAETEPAVAFGDALESSSDVEELEQPAMLERRGGVSALPTGAFNVRFANWSSPYFEKEKAHQDFLFKSLSHCPLFQELEHDILRAIVDTMEIEKFEQGDAIYEKNNVGRSGYLLISGAATAETDADDPLTLLRRSSKKEVNIFEGTFFGEHTMLFGFRRRMTVRAIQPTVVGKLKRDVYYNVVTRSAMHERSVREKYLRTGVPMFETFDDELIARIADIMEKRTFKRGEVIVKQGDVGAEFFMVLRGQCEASIRVAKVGSEGFDEHVVRTYSQGERFGELAFINRTPRAATVTAATQVQLLSLDRDDFERVVGSLDIKQKENYASDPRKALADFYGIGGVKGPRGVDAESPEGQSAWFAVYRPTSRDALAKMLNQTAVGKGLNVKGKSAKRNHLSGFVPFLQISEERHKTRLHPPPANSRATIYYQNKEAQHLALLQLERVEKILQERGETAPFHPIRKDESYSDVFGISVPEEVLREAYILQPDITFQAGWETGRASEPAFMEMNLHAVRSNGRPKVVLYQYDLTNPMNPHGLLIAYAESMVKPVVSDFDTFTVGSRGMRYEKIAADQSDLMAWTLDNTKQILEDPNALSWNSRWLEILEKADAEGFHPYIPEFGFGDPTSYRLIAEVIEATKFSGAVRHGAECFNFYFPQELDSEYLIIWDGFDGKPWAYRDASGLREFLLERITEGYCFPMNPVWPIRDEGWFDVYDALRKSPHAIACLNAWFPAESGVMQKIEQIHREHPEGFQVRHTDKHEVVPSQHGESPSAARNHWRMLRSMETVRREMVRRTSHD